MIESHLWILFLSLFLILLLIAVYTILKATLVFSRRFCMCVKWGACCCYLQMDWESYQRERDSLQRLRELRHRHRQLLMQQQISTFSQIPGPIPDSVYIIPSSANLGFGFLLVPAAAAPPRPIREQLTEEQRRRILERILVFSPFSSETAPPLVEEELATNTSITNTDVRAKALEEGSSQELSPQQEGASADEPMQSHPLASDEEALASSPIAIPFHEEPLDYENACAICLDAFSDGELINESTDCQHFFHKDCLLGWLDQHDVCPCCRRTMVTEQDWKRVMQEDRARVREQVQRAVTTATVAPPQAAN
jgi:hypothetical protein